MKNLSKTETKIKSKVTKRVSPNGVNVVQCFEGKEYVFPTKELPNMFKADEYEIVDTKKGKA